MNLLYKLNTGREKRKPDFEKLASALTSHVLKLIIPQLYMFTNRICTNSYIPQLYIFTGRNCVNSFITTAYALK